jgi:AcrR family transcriptional regulator
LHEVEICASLLLQEHCSLKDMPRTKAKTQKPGAKGKPSEVRTGLRELNNARRRKDILGRARTLFVRKGFEKTTMSAIARAARTAPRTVYNFFPTKIDVLAEILREAIELQMTAELAAAGPLPPDPLKGILQLIEIQARALGSWPKHFLRLVSSHAIAMNEDTIARRLHSSSDELFKGQIRDRLQEYQACGRLAKIDVLRFAHTLFTCVNGSYFSWLYGDDDDIKSLVAAAREHLVFLLPLAEAAR